MTDITIPPEALEAAIAAAIDAEPNIRDQLHAACLAMLRAWPGMFPQVGYHGMEIILPLPKENING